MTRETLERHQVWVYLAAVLTGLALGAVAPRAGPAMEALVWPCLAALLYATFTQVPLAHLPAAFRDMRFMAAVMLGNFVVLPALAWGLTAFLPDDRALRLGVLLVLLVPCTDWFITFAHQGGGDVRRAIAVTPAVLVVQMVLLPVYLWLFLGDGVGDLVSASHMATVFGVVILGPLLLAYRTERWVARDPARAPLIGRLGWLPVPLLAVVVLLIAGSQVEAVIAALPRLGPVTGVFVAFLVGAAACGVLMARLLRLPGAQARTLMFSYATRNSFVVLPFALALPAAQEVAALVIVLQSLVELLGVLVLLWLLPRVPPPGGGGG